MEKKQYYQLNFDYESVLFGYPVKSHDHNIVKTLEFSFFIDLFNRENQDQRILITELEYPQDYLDYLRSLKIYPQVISRKEFSGVSINGWGDLKNIALERKLNSKIYTTQWAIENLDMLDDVQIFKNYSDFLSFINERDKKWKYDRYVLKNPHFYSGKRFYFMSRNQLENKNVKSFAKYFENSSLIFSPWFERIFDIGHRVVLEKNKPKIVPYLLYCSPQGQFMGGRIFRSEQEFYSFLLQDSFMKKSFSQKTLKKIIQKNLNDVVTFMEEKKVYHNYNIDSFFYHSHDKKICYYPLSEINYRNSLGNLLLSLKKMLKVGQVGEMVLVKRKKESKIDGTKKFYSLLKNDLYTLFKKEGICPLSPIFDEKIPEYLFYFIIANNEKKLLHLRKIVQKISV